MHAPVSARDDAHGQTSRRLNTRGTWLVGWSRLPAPLHTLHGISVPSLPVILPSVQKTHNVPPAGDSQPASRQETREANDALTMDTQSQSQSHIALCGVWRLCAIKTKSTHKSTRTQHSPLPAHRGHGTGSLCSGCTRTTKARRRRNVQLEDWNEGWVKRWVVTRVRRSTAPESFHTWIII